MRRLSAALLALGLIPAAGSGGEVAAFVVTNGAEIRAPLAAPGHVEKGAALFTGATPPCADCHDLAADGRFARRVAGMGAPRLRLWIVNAGVIAPGTAMPAYHDISAERAAADPEARQPRLSAQDVEDVLAFLRHRFPPAE